MRIAKNNRQNIFWNNKIVSLLFVSWFFFLFKPVLALSFVFDPLDPPPPPYGLEYLIAWILHYVFIISGLILVAVLIKAGFLFLFSTGSPDRVNDAKDQLWKAFFGLLLVLSTFVVLRTLNPELVPEAMIIKPALVLEQHRQSGVSFCYKTKAVHFQDINFKCESITEGACAFSIGDLADQEEARYGQAQQHCRWICQNPQIKHQGVWRRICGNLAASWLEMVDLNVSIYLRPTEEDPTKKEPHINIADSPSSHFYYRGETVFHCTSIFDKRCIGLTTREEKCHIIEEIKFITPKYQCHIFQTTPEIQQRAERKFTHYRIVNKTIENIEGVTEKIDFGIIFYDQKDLEGRCYVYISANDRGKIHLIPAYFRSLTPPAGAPVLPPQPVQGNFHSALIFSINQEAKRGPAKVFLYQGVEFTRKSEEIDFPRNEDKERRTTISDYLRNNVRSIRIDSVRPIEIDGIERQVDIPIIAVLFSEQNFAGFCDFFVECDGNLGDNKIGQEIAVDPGPYVPIRLPWLFFAPTAESIIIIAGERI